MKFQVGDKVKQVGNVFRGTKDKIGVVVSVCESDLYPYQVQFDELVDEYHINWLYFESELEGVKE